ncbi:hypothetical protein [Rhodococcus qingshengii]|uniref:hypothetical protein n=1 Tax=Rhodococcus qingshengii TaxID=334542 RepID=UPI00237C78C7|nr:hypothetical protein [Rhodococcus qingshengii]WCT06039.1 hypothetical protein PI247_29930 [Rhodococcus qingshengii]
MASIRSWLAVVAVFGLVPAVSLCVLNGFVPQPRDLADPLGRPSALSNELITSAHQLDLITAELAPKHGELADTIGGLGPLSRSLTSLAGEAGALPGHAGAVNWSASNVVGISRPLPGLIDTVVASSRRANPMVGGLAGAIDGVSTELAAVDTQMVSVQTTLRALGPRADNLAATLATIEEEASRVRALGPLLSILGPAVNGAERPADPTMYGGR